MSVERLRHIYRVAIRTAIASQKALEMLGVSPSDLLSIRNEEMNKVEGVANG